MAISNPGPGHSGTAGSLNSVPASQNSAISFKLLSTLQPQIGNDWGQQYVPDLMEKEAEVFGNENYFRFSCTSRS